MPYIVQSAYNERQNFRIQVTENSKRLFDRVRKDFGMQVLNLETTMSKINFTEGYKFPIPNEVFELLTSIPVRELRPILNSDIGILISTEIADLIESFEPKTHQYFPVQIKGSDGEISENEYFALNICTNLNALDFEKSNVIKTDVPEDRRRYSFGRRFLVHKEDPIPNLTEPYDYYVSNEKLCGNSIWFQHGSSLVTQFFVSDEMYEALETAGGFDGGFEPVYRVGVI